MALVRVQDLAGIPLYYDRFRDGAYGVEASPWQPYMDDAFAKSCNTWVADMLPVLSKAGFDVVQIWSGGVGRTGSGKSYHHQNRAFDLDGLIFSDGTKWIADTFPRRPYLYLAIEGFLRRHFGTVLAYDYDAKHQDHFHFDNGTSVKFKRDARSHTLFVQHTLVQLFNQDIGQAGTDGVFAPDTETALARARRGLGIGGFSDVGNWRAYIGLCIDKALSMESGLVQA